MGDTSVVIFAATTSVCYGAYVLSNREKEARQRSERWTKATSQISNSISTVYEAVLKQRIFMGAFFIITGVLEIIYILR